MITSPQYPEQYPNKLNCTYVIRSPKSEFNTITISFHVLDIEYEKDCDFDNITVSRLAL